jgi:hypothetical protein
MIPYVTNALFYTHGQLPSYSYRVSELAGRVRGAVSGSTAPQSCAFERIGGARTGAKHIRALGCQRLTVDRFAARARRAATFSGGTVAFLGLPPKSPFFCAAAVFATLRARPPSSLWCKS